MLSEIQNSLINLKDEIFSYFYTTDAKWRKFTNRIRNYENEGIWVFLVGCGYALGKQEGIETLTKLLIGEGLKQPTNPKIWFEAEPTQPRKNEGKTHVDLSLGAISRRTETQSGIKLDTRSPSWVCLCEAKFNSDISPKVTYDVTRNQLIRVIENAICFQNSGIYADSVYVTVITPRAYSHKRPLLELKFYEYKSNPDAILNDINSCKLDKRSSNYWFYPDNIAQRIEAINLRWVYFEDLIGQLPDSEVSEWIKKLWGELM